MKNKYCLEDGASNEHQSGNKKVQSLVDESFRDLAVCVGEVLFTFNGFNFNERFNKLEDGFQFLLEEFSNHEFQPYIDYLNSVMGEYDSIMVSHAMQAAAELQTLSMIYR